MAEGGSVSIECGFCCQKDKDIQDPRVLPCSHIFCRGCLTGQLELLKVIRCTACSKVYDVVVDNLPTYKPDVPKHKCNVCTKQGKGDQPAVMYCHSCTKKYCERHQESHGDINDHITMPIVEYLYQADGLKTRHCTEHKEQPYSLGCGVCLTVFCPNCVSPFNLCTIGKAHRLLNLGDLVTRLISAINKLREAMICKEEKLSALFKKTSKSLSEYEEETKEMIEKLHHQTKDQQSDAIQTKYKKLEEQLIKTRSETRAEILLFLEEVGNNLTNLANHRLRIEGRVRNNNQVDIVNTYRDTKTEIVQITDVQLPVLSVDIVKALSISDEKRDIEAKIVPVGRIYISCEPVLSGLPPPKSLTLLKSVETKSFCHSLCHHKGNTYLGLANGKIDVIGKDFYSKTFASILGTLNWPPGLTVYQDHIYSLISGVSNEIKVYDLKSKLIQEWDRKGGRCNTRLAIVTDKVVVPDHKGKQLTVYSPTGQIIKHISCPMLEGDGPAACAVDESSVIVTSCGSSVVCRVDINSEQTLWKCGDIANPKATAMYGKNLVCIASDRKISFLNNNTGQLISDIEVPAVPGGLGWFIDIDIQDTTLIASSRINGSNNVWFFKLNN